MAHKDTIIVETFLRGYHAYNRIWLNIEEGQHIVLQKQPDNQFDRCAIAGFVSGLKANNKDELTVVGNLPRDLARALRNVEDFSYSTCVVVNPNPVGATGQKGLHVAIKIELRIPREKANIVKRALRRLNLL